MFEAEFVLGGLEAGLDRPSEPGDAGEFGEAHIGGGEDDIVGALVRVAQAAPHHEPVVEALPGLLEPEQAKARPESYSRGPLAPAPSLHQSPGTTSLASSAAVRVRNEPATSRSFERTASTCGFRNSQGLEARRSAHLVWLMGARLWERFECILDRRLHPNVLEYARESDPRRPKR
jgi:hypothetical protein